MQLIAIIPLYIALSHCVLLLYSAVTGLPDPRPDHAVVMARFAGDILTRFHVLSKELEVTLGPDTGNLALRIGMHSGPGKMHLLRQSQH